MYSIRTERKIERTPIVKAYIQWLYYIKALINRTPQNALLSNCKNIHTIHRFESYTPDWVLAEWFKALIFDISIKKVFMNRAALNIKIVLPPTE